MPDHFLVVASDAQWLAGTQLLLENQSDDGDPPRVTPCRDDAAALRELDKDTSGTISVAIIYGYHAGASTSFEHAAKGYGARELSIDLRAKRRSLPILLVAPLRLDLLQRYAAGIDGVEIIGEESIGAVREALRRMQKVTPELQPWAQVDIFIGVESIRVRVMLADGQVLADMPVASDMRSWLVDEQEEFGPRWQLYKYDNPSGGARLNDGWPDRLCTVGERLHQYLLSDPQRTAIESCLERVGTMENIHFRFITDSDRFPDVPFEALRDRVRGKFVRDMSPLARRILLHSSESTVAGKGYSGAASALSEKVGLTGRVLLILSDPGRGALRVGQHRFHKQDTQSFRRLPNLEAELAGITKVWADRGRNEPVGCVLKAGIDNIAILEAAIGEGPWDIVHFCGHSVRADDGDVFLVLPGKQPLELTGLSMNRFAQILRQGRVGLLVLSSCEGASSQSLFRVAQEGLPATIGFRWEVMSDEAEKFSGRLHDNLARGKSIGKAYLDALRALTQDSPAFLSAMLVVQQDAWARADS